ncbi:MAG: transcription antitermination factor NusB, partial [Planctomycetota bacterium]|nr:transcription antitermination factor NusB [Planctomycetota bacterium]
MTSAIDPSISPARDRVIRRLARDVRRFPDLDLAPIDVEGLDARDAAFAHALHDGTIRRWLTLEYLLQLGLSKPIETLEPRVRAALLAAAAQLLFMDKAPAHAAVHESVEWAKRVIRPGAGSLVNAALRRLTERLTEDRAERSEDARNHIPLSSGAALILAEPCLPENDVERLAVATSNPVSLLRHWLKSMSMREVRALAVHGLARPPVILNTACAAAPLPEETTDSGDPLLIPHEAPGHHVFRGDRPRLISLLAQRNDIWVQDPASSLAVMSVTDLKPALVIDPCAGRGTKTRQLAAVFPNAEIIATDVDDDRRNDLTRAFRNHPTVRAIHPRDLAKWNARADLI